MSAAASARPRYLLWCDLETSGLDPEIDEILEIAWSLTEFAAPYAAADLGPRYVTASEDHLIDPGPDGPPLYLMDPKVRSMHEESGLLAALRDAAGSMPSLKEVEDLLLSLSEGWPTSPADGERDERVVIAGNSVGFDLGFLRTEMPRFAKRLSHRVFDVSSHLLLCSSLGMKDDPDRKPTRHRAVEDVENSLAQARRCAAFLDHGSWT